MQKLVFINGNGVKIDLTAGNFGIVNWAGLSNTGLNIQTQQVPFQDGGVFLDALMEQREIELTLAIYDGNNLELRYQKKRELIAALNPKLGEGVLIYTNDHLSRQIHAVPQIPLFENKNSNDAGTLKANIVFSCPSPYWEDVEDTEVTFNVYKQPIVINDGDVPTQIKMDWFTTGVKNNEVINVTQNKKIKINGSLNENVRIDTNIGNKKIYSENIFLNPSLGLDFGAMAYSEDLHLFVASKNSNVVYTSLDGINWTLRNTVENASGGVNKIIYSERVKLFVMVSDSTLIYTSSDGINWVSIDSGITDDGYVRIRCVTFSNELNLFVAFAKNETDNYILTSSDGINWTLNTFGYMGHDVIYSEYLHLFVVVGDNGCILTSSDGINWTSRTSGTNESIDEISYNEKIGFVACCADEHSLLTSSDGLTWSLNSLFDGNYVPLAITYAENLNLFICVGYHRTTPQTNSGFIAVSPDGINWIEKYYSTEDVEFYFVQYFGEIGKCFLFGANRGEVYITEDLESIVSLYNTIATIQNIVYSEKLKLYVAIGSSYSSAPSSVFAVILTSSDGINWTEKYFIQGGELNSITYSEKLNMFIACGNSGAFYSHDGETWTSSLQYTCSSVLWAEDISLFIMLVRDQSQSRIYTSPDGINWTPRTEAFATRSNSSCSCYSKKESLIVFGVEHIILTSSDGINWTTIETNLGVYGALNSVVYSEILNKFVCVGRDYNDEVTLISYDGVNWDLTSNNLQTYLNSISFSEKEGLFLGIDFSGNSYLSIDGINWKMFFDTGLQSGHIGYTNDNFYILGTNSIYKVFFELKENLINRLSIDSDMNFGLNVGLNKLLINKTDGDVVVHITFRRKYIGV